MHRHRILAALAACGALAALSACGGGGGGTTPPTGSGGPPPVTSTPTPTSSPSTTPTPIVTATPSPTPTGLTADSRYTLSAQSGPQVNGKQNWYTAGVTVAWTPNPGSPGMNGDTSAGANASTGFAAVDGMSCASTQEPAASTKTYSTHAFVGIYYNGVEYALPQAIGMEAPTEPTVSGHPNDNWEVETQQCEYNVHTHDYAGLVHIEDPNFPQNTSTISTLPYSPTLQTLLDLWGVQLVVLRLDRSGTSRAFGNDVDLLRKPRFAGRTAWSAGH